MRSIIVKEIRENLRWTLLLMLAVAVALSWAVYTDAAKSGLALVGSAMSATTAITFPVAGLALGFLLILQDRRRGRWGFVMHRPVSTTTIFFGKVITGVALYTVACGVPLMVVVAWVATPGHIAAPVSERMLSPLTADLFDGLMWFAAGLLIAARAARWIGSRLMPAGLVLVVAAYAWVVPFHLWQAMLIVACGMAIVLPAAWAAFAAGDDYERQPIIARGLQALAVATGLALVVGAVLNLGAAGIEWAHPTAYWEYQEYRVLADGQVLISTRKRNDPDTETDLAGRPIYDRRPTMMAGGIGSDGFPADDSPWQRRRYLSGLHEPGAYAQVLQAGGRNCWYYVVDRQTIEGYDPQTGRFIGSIGPGGMTPPTVLPTPFAHPLYLGQSTPRNILSSPFGVYRLDIDRGELHTVFAADPGDPVTQVPTLFTEKQDGPEYTAVATRSQVHVFKEDRPVCTIPLDAIDQPYGRVDIGRSADGQFVLHYISGSIFRGGGPSDRIVVAGADGKIVSRTELPPLSVMSQYEPWYTKTLQTISVPPGVLALLRATGNNEITMRDWLAVLSAGFASAIAVAVLARRYGLDRRGRIMWIKFTAIAGIPGLLTLLAMRSLPGRVRCDSCRRPRLVTRSRCEHCAAEFSAPPAEGIEVFEAA